MKDLQKEPLNWAKIGRKILYYLGGVIVGMILVWAFWWRKRTDLPSLWPKGIIKEKLVKSSLENNPVNDCYVNCLQMNDSLLSLEIEKGEVLFTKSKARRKPYPVYAVKTKSGNGDLILLYLESKDSTYNIFNVEAPGTQNDRFCDCEKVSY